MNRSSDSAKTAGQLSLVDYVDPRTVSASLDSTADRARQAVHLAIVNEVPQGGAINQYEIDKETEWAALEHRMVFLKRMASLVTCMNRLNQSERIGYINVPMDVMKNWKPETFGTVVPTFLAIREGRFVLNEAAVRRHEEGSLATAVDDFEKMEYEGVRGAPVELEFTMAQRITNAIRKNWYIHEKEKERYERDVKKAKANFEKAMAEYNKATSSIARKLGIGKKTAPKKPELDLSKIPRPKTFEQFITFDLATYAPTKDRAGRAGFSGDILTELDFFKELHRVCFPEIYQTGSVEERHFRG